MCREGDLPTWVVGEAGCAAGAAGCQGGEGGLEPPPNCRCTGCFRCSRLVDGKWVHVPGLRALVLAEFASPLTAMCTPGCPQGPPIP